MHDTEPSSGAYHPGAQGVAAAPPPSHLYPGSHCTVSFVEALTYDPGDTATQVADPSSLFTYPLGHTSQVVLASFTWNCPTLHLMHVFDDVAPETGEYRPGLQGVHPSFAVDALADE